MIDIMIKMTSVTLVQSMEPMPIFTYEDGTPKKEIDKQYHKAHVDRLKESGYGTCVLNKKMLTKEDRELIVDGKIPSITVINNCVKLSLYYVEFIGVSSMDDIDAMDTFAFIFAKSFIRELTI